MKKDQIKVGGTYSAKINGNLVTVRVDAIREATAFRRSNYSGKSEYADKTVYDVTNLKTGRSTTFRSAAKFRGPAANPPSGGASTKERSATSVGTERNGSKVVAVVEPVASPVISTPPPSTTLSQKLSEASQATTDNHPHVIVRARAGTGKTTTLIEGLKRLKGVPTEILPSPQQQAVWDSLFLSKDAKSVCFVAFNKSIAEELQRRVPTGCDAMTMHSLGRKAVTRQFGKIQISSYCVQDHIAAILERDIRELRKYKPVVLKATEDLVGLVKQNLSASDPETLTTLAAYYDVDTNGSSSEIFDLVPYVLDRCRDVAANGRIDFDDMIWLPIALDLPLTTYDLLLIDEAQDLNRCQQALAKRAGKRLVFVGDDKQSIYGFAGADAESLPRLFSQLSASGRGCIELPLTVTRRCGKKIVAEAQRYVPEFTAHESNPEGEILEAKYEQEGDNDPNCYRSRVAGGDMVLCRCNAPLVGQCFKFLKQGRKATIQGRDVGQGLISTVKKMNATDTADLTEKLSNWFHNETQKEQKKRNPNDHRLMALQDRYDCLNCFIEGQTTVDAVLKRIESVFTDDKTTLGIRLSSIHKAKGLEAHRVYFLRPKGAECPHPMAKSEWQKAQEWNLCYVAVTRAIETLIYVS